MAKQFTAIMAREAIIGPTINSQADGLERNIGRKGYCGELEGKGGGLSFYLCIPPSLSLVSPPPTPLFFHFNPTLPSLSPIFLTILTLFLLPDLPTYVCIFQVILQ